ncbi:MAG: site-specific integrase [Proteobacteria bacterium]|nr:site-specific integrase [Pseudomonadota bacterium]
MSAKWIGTRYKGVRYYEHPTRKHGVKKDRYYTIRYQRDGKRIEEGLGWASELNPKDRKHWTAEKAALVLAELKEAGKGLKQGPARLSERREIEEKRKEVEQVERERIEKEAVTFNDFFINTYLPQAKADKKPDTARREEGFFNNWFNQILGHLPLKTLTPFHIERLKKEMSDKQQSNRSIEYALAVIRQVFHMARHRGIYVGESPTVNVKKPKVDNGRMKFLTRKEAEELLKALKEKSQDVHDMSLLSLHAGLRFGEIASLTWQDVDLERGVVTIRDAKAGSRYAFLTDQAEDMFRNRIQGKPSDYIFQRRGGGKIEKISHSFFRTVDDLQFNKGIDDPRLRVCFHTCRHSYASWLIEQGTDLYTVQKLLGHKTNIMTQRYAHLSENKLKDAAKALGTALSKKSAGNDQSEQVLNFSQ